jgi:inositol-polyphosphate multikinase
MHYPRSDGLRCHISGSLIAKPCTPEEVAFYESSALHPMFRAFMPTFIGTLSSIQQQQQLDLLAAESEGAILIPASGTSSSIDTPTHSENSRPTGDGSVQSPCSQFEVPWMPSHGRKLDTGLSIVLENVASGFKRPNVLDVKLGARLWADDALPAKRAKLDAISQETTSSSLGFRIAGMKVWCGVKGLKMQDSDLNQTDPYAIKYECSSEPNSQVVEKDGYKHYSKWYGRSLDDETVKQGFEIFLEAAKSGRVDRSKLIAHRLACGLRRVQSILELEESRMYSASILIVYEGDTEALETTLEEEKRRTEGKIFEDRYGVKSLDTQVDGTVEPVGVRFTDETVANGSVRAEVSPGAIQLPVVDDEHEEEDEVEPCKVHDLRLIDFAHANWTPGQGPDENVLMGVRSLVKIMEGLARD